MSNAARHSGSPDAWVRITCADGNLELAVEDRGTRHRGTGVRGRSGAGMGMVSMRERAELIGGELHVRRSAGGGTVVHLRVPAMSARRLHIEVA